jgi:RimJ/RimL family protein N-acetyltransferase
MIAQSKILCIRQLNYDDCEQLFNIYSNKEAMKYRSNKPLNKIEEATDMIHDTIDMINNNIEFRYAIILKKKMS